jgi:hypothetical protein
LKSQDGWEAEVEKEDIIDFLPHKNMYFLFINGEYDARVKDIFYDIEGKILNIRLEGYIVKNKESFEQEIERWKEAGWLVSDFYTTQKGE